MIHKTSGISDWTMVERAKKPMPKATGSRPVQIDQCTRATEAEGPIIKLSNYVPGQQFGCPELGFPNKIIQIASNSRKLKTKSSRLPNSCFECSNICRQQLDQLASRFVCLVAVWTTPRQKPKKHDATLSREFVQHRWEHTDPGDMICYDMLHVFRESFIGTA